MQYLKNLYNFLAEWAQVLYEYRKQKGDRYY